MDIRIRLATLLFLSITQVPCMPGQDAPVHTIPARNIERELLIPVRIADRYPLWFALDTGLAHTVIDVNAAAMLGLKRPDGISRTSATAVRLDLGTEAFDTRLQILDIGAYEYKRAYDQPLDGLLGMDFFQNFVVTLDYDAAVVSLRNRMGVVPGDSSIPIKIRDSLPYVDATMKLAGRPPVRQSFQLDTSTGDALNDDAFSHLHQSPIGPDLGRALYFRIGSYRFTGVNGTSGSPKVGGELLHRFLVTIDVPHHQLILTPSRQFADAFLFDTSGLDLERTDSGLKILKVFPRTPAQEAQLAPGDTILWIDGQPAKTFSVPQVRLMFHEVGCHALLIESPGRPPRFVTIKLRTLL